MSIKIGNTDINKLYLGNSEINKAFLGDILVFGANESLLTFNIGTAPTEVLASSGTGDEAQEIRPLDFFEYDTNTWGLLYTSKSSNLANTRKFKLATSPKSGFNHNWTKQGTVLIGGGISDWDYNLGGATLTKNGSLWILIYCSITSGKIGIATGTNLLSLTKNASNPVIDNTASSGFNKFLRHPNAVIKGTDLYCIYEGRAASANQIINSKIGYATAPLSDLTDWTISNDVLIEPTDISYASGRNNAVCNAKIIKIGIYYYLWFQGYSPGDDYPDFNFGGTSYAYSTDLLNWTIVGTENYHVYMGLFGYNSSTEFYEYCQEITPVYDGTTLSLYMWSNTATGIGKIDLDGGAFTNTFRGFEYSDNFNDNSIDVSKWTVGTGNGISVSETGGKLSIVANGSATESAFPAMITSVGQLNNDDGVIVCCFNINRSTPTTGDFFSIELSDATNTNSDVIRIARSTTPNKVNVVIRANNVTVVGGTTISLDFTGNETFKFVISERNRVQVFVSDGDNFLNVYNAILDINNTDWNFKILANNSIGGGQTILLENFCFGEYDSGLKSTFIP